MIVYNYRIMGLTTQQTYGDGELEDFISGAQWQVIAKDDETLHNACSIPQWLSFVPDASRPYIPRNEMTDEAVVGWVKAVLGNDKIAELEAEVVSRIPPAGEAPQ